MLGVLGGRDDVVIQLNGAAYAYLQCEKALRIVSGATLLCTGSVFLQKGRELPLCGFRGTYNPEESEGEGDGPF
jgi:hypothetical protein